MKAKILIAALPIMMLAGAGVAFAQDTGASQPPAKQSAPSDSSHASGHDVQTGKPETGEIGIPNRVPVAARARARPKPQVAPPHSGSTFHPRASSANPRCSRPSRDAPGRGQAAGRGLNVVWRRIASK